MKTDSQLQADVMAELKWDPSVTHEHIGVAVKDAIVTLSGTVPNYIEKYAAARSAQKVSGVRAVVEKIEVKLLASAKRDDQDIAKAISDQFRWNVQIPDLNVKVQVENAWVTLSGEVDWGFQRAAAEKSVRKMTGVRGVSNLITIKVKSVQPEVVKSRIEDELKREAVREAKKITVQVKDGTAILSGEVHSFTEVAEAKWAAWSAPGITSVESHLTVSPH